MSSVHCPLPASASRALVLHSSTSAFSASISRWASFWASLSDAADETRGSQYSHRVLLSVV